MQGDATIQMTGNLAADPELRISQGGQPVCKFRLLVTGRKYDKSTNQWADGDTTGWLCVTFGKQAENLAESAGKGTRVTVIGTVSQRSYDQDGETKWVTEVSAEDVSVSLKWDQVKVQRMARASKGEVPAEDAWATATPAGQR